LYMKNYFIPHELTPWTCNYFLQAAWMFWFVWRILFYCSNSYSLFTIKYIDRSSFLFVLVIYTQTEQWTLLPIQKQMHNKNYEHQHHIKSSSKKIIIWLLLNPGPQTCAYTFILLLNQPH
jgi:hypothetical protein